MPCIFHLAAASRPEASDSNLNIDPCKMIYTEEPLEDPAYDCWLTDTDGDEIEYVCVMEHPCLEINDDEDHGDDSY